MRRCACNGDVARTASRIFPIPDSGRKLRNWTGARSVPGSLKRGLRLRRETGTDAGISLSSPTCNERKCDGVSAVVAVG